MLLKNVFITKTMDFTQECNFLLHFPHQKTFPQVQPFAQEQLAHVDEQF